MTLACLKLREGVRLTRQNWKELQQSYCIFADEETEAQSGYGTCVKSQGQISQVVVKSKDLTLYRCDFQVAGTLGCESLLNHLRLGFFIFQNSVSKLYSGGDRDDSNNSICLARHVHYTK